MNDGHEPGVGRHGHRTVWLVLANARSDDPISAFLAELDALAHAEALRLAHPGERPLIREVIVQGEGRRCRLCGEPVVLDDIADPESWRHADDANDLGDHTAEV